MKRMMTALTCAAAVALSTAAPAHADSAVSTASAEYRLEVYDAIERHGDTSESRARSTTLRCAPVGGDHPRAQEACDLIAEHGTIARVPAVADVFCTMEYQPVTARVSGAEEYEQTFGNHCGMINAKGAIFDF